MIERMRAATAATLVVAGLAALGGATRAQEPAAVKPAEPAKKKHDVARRVPAHFGQIGLTTEQRANIYAIQGKRFDRIEELEQQIAKERAEMLAQCEGVLTDTQKKLLDNLRRASAEPGGAAKTAEASKPK